MCPHFCEDTKALNCKEPQYTITIKTILAAMVLTCYEAVLYYLTSKAFPPFNETDLYDILTTSRDKNSTHMITGILLYNNRNIMQVLEGLESEVKKLFEKIKNDTRHADIHQIAAKYIQERSFSKWSMAFKNADKSIFKQVQAYNNPEKNSLFPDNPGSDISILSLIRIFIAINPII